MATVSSPAHIIGVTHATWGFTACPTGMHLSRTVVS